MKPLLILLRRFFEKLTARIRSGREPAATLKPPHRKSRGNAVSGLDQPPSKPADPRTSEEAHARLHRILNAGQPLDQLSYEDFLLGWVAMAYIAPGLNPDEAGEEYSGWPSGWQPAVAEAFRRFKLKELTAEELYPRPY